MYKDEIIQICEQYGITNYTINDDMSVDTPVTVYLEGCDLDHIPIKFNRIKGSFDCDGNKLKNLNNSPDYVSGSFYCSFNYIETIKDCPKYIGSDFHCFYNNIKTRQNINLLNVDGEILSDILWLF